MQSGQHNAIRSPHPASEQEKQNGHINILFN